MLLGNFSLCLFIFCLFTYSSSADDVGNANEYIDEVLHNLRHEPWILKKLEPLDIPDVEEESFQIRNGQIKGLSSLYRHGDCTLAYDGDIVNVTVEVAVKDVVVDCKYRAKALFFWVKEFIMPLKKKFFHYSEDDLRAAVEDDSEELTVGPVLGLCWQMVRWPTVRKDRHFLLSSIAGQQLANVDPIILCYLGHATIAVEHLAVRMIVTGKDGRAKLESFKVIHLGNYKIKKITGMSVVLNWLLKLIANAVAKNSRGKIIDGLENGVATAVGDLLEKYQLPRFGYF